MKIIEYDSRYDEQIKDLLCELQNHIVKIDAVEFYEHNGYHARVVEMIK